MSEDMKIADIVRDCVLAPDDVYTKVKKTHRHELLKSSTTMVLNLIPSVGGAVASLIEKGIAYSDIQLFKKLARYIYEIIDIDYKNREKFMAQIEEAAQDYRGDVLSGIINRLDNINKTVILANLTKSKVKGEISIVDFFRLSSILEKIPYTDLTDLMSFSQPQYLDGGVTEILYSAGALVQTNIATSENNKYALSINGCKLLKYGLLISDIEMETNNSTEVQNLTWHTFD